MKYNYRALHYKLGTLNSDMDECNKVKVETETAPLKNPKIRKFDINKTLASYGLFKQEQNALVVTTNPL